VETLAAKGEWAIPYVRKWLAYDRDALIYGACFILKKIDCATWKKALPDIEAILNESPSQRTLTAASVLEHYNFNWSEAYSDFPNRLANLHLFHLMHCDDEDALEQSAEFLGESGNRHVVRILIDHYDSEDSEYVKSWIIQIIGEIGGNPAARKLVEILANKSDEDEICRRPWGKFVTEEYAHREEAVQALASAGATVIVPELLQILECESDVDIKCRIIDTLGEIGDPRAVEKLIRISENDWYCIGSACEALGKIGDPKAMQPLVNVLARLPQHTKAGVVRAMGDLGCSGAFEPLVSLLDCTSVPYERYGIIDAIGKIRRPKTKEKLLSILQKGEVWPDKVCAIEALVKTGDNRIFDIALPYLAHDNARIRGDAVKALALTGDARVVKLLLELAQNEKDEDVLDLRFLALASFDSPELLLFDKDELENSTGLILAKAWMTGRNLDAVAALEDKYKRIAITKVSGFPEGLFFITIFHSLIKARWGDKKALETCLEMICIQWFFERKFYQGIIARMPDGFPKHDHTANYATRNKQARAIKEWFIENKSRLEWNKNKRRYILRDK
jgi:HEAT repeat protein